MNLPESGYTPTNLRVLMTVKGLTVEDVAKATGVRNNTVVRWRSGKSSMPHSQWFLVFGLKT